MVKSCAAFNCTSRWKRKSDISFHYFPVENSSLLKKWVTATRRKNFKPNKYSVLCSRHFTEDDYHMIWPKTVRRKLKNDAFPTIFNFPPHMQNVLTKQRKSIVKELSVKEIASLKLSLVDEPFVKEESNSSLRESEDITLRDFNPLYVKEEIMFPGCDNTDLLSVVNLKEGMHSEASIEMDKRATDDDDIVGNINKTVSSHRREENGDCLNDSLTPFCFVGIKVEKPDDYESDPSLAKSKHSSEEFPINCGTEYNIGIEGLKEKLRLKLNNNSRIAIKMEKVEDGDGCKASFQLSEETSVTVDKKRKFDFNSVVDGCDMKYSTDEFIRGIEWQDYPVLCLRPEEKTEEQ